MNRVHTFSNIRAPDSPSREMVNWGEINIWGTLFGEYIYVMSVYIFDD
jgi:hypothetical protein